MSKTTQLGWHVVWSRYDRVGPQLGYGDSRVVRVGETLTVPPPARVGEYGLHFCPKLQDVLRIMYAGDNRSSWLCRVKVEGVVKSTTQYDTDGIRAGSSRTVLEMKPLRPMLIVMATRLKWLLGFEPSSVGYENHCWTNAQQHGERILTIEPKQYGGFAPEHACNSMLSYVKDTAAVKFGHGDGGDAYLKWRDGFERRLVKLFKQQGAQE